MNYFINIPEAIKNINSHLSFDDLIPSIVRLTKTLIKTDKVELYVCSKGGDSLNLIAALGTNRGRSIQVMFGEGVIGEAALTRMIFHKGQLIAGSNVTNYEKLEFVILLQNTDKFDAMIKEDNIRKLVASYPFENRENQPPGFVSISGGTAPFSTDGQSLKELIERADRALYKSKELGKNCMTEYSSTQSKVAQR